MTDSAAPLRAIGPAPEPPRKPQIRRVEAVVNPLSGSVGAGAAETLEAMLVERGLAARVCEAEPRELAGAVRAAIDAAPDLVIILAGDGTAATAAHHAGMEGPPLATLAGGTMNMLPHALYGPVDWRTGLESILTGGTIKTVSGGEVGDKRFYVAAILGAPALWARAREAVRKGRLDIALSRARRALGRAFSGSLHYELGADAADEEGEALTLICPLISRRLQEEAVLEAAALDPKGAADAFRLGFNALTGDWRDDPSVHVHLITSGRAWARGSIPAVFDGEPTRLPREVEIRFVPEAFRALVPATLPEPR